MPDNKTITKLTKRLKPCLKPLEKTLSIPRLYFANYRNSPYQHESFFLAHSDLSSIAKIGEYVYRVLPLPIKNAYFWVGVNVYFKKKSQWDIDQLSIMICEGLLTDDHKIPILRAEWDSYHQYTPNYHAQPHWHVYTTTSDYPKRPFLDQIETEIQDFGKPDRDKIPNTTLEKTPKIHFAMATQWHINADDNAQVNLSDEYLKDWLPACIKYISAQLSYAYN